MNEARAVLRGEVCRQTSEVLELEAERLATATGVFETLRVTDGEAFDVAAHLDRLAAGARESELDGAPAMVHAAVGQVASSVPAGDYRLRLSLAADDLGLIGTVSDWRAPDEATMERGVVAAVSPVPIDEGDRKRRTKSLAWRRAALGDLELQPECFDVLYVNRAGRVAEGARSNLLVLHAGEWRTPPLSEGCLPGTVRRLLLEAGLVLEEPVQLAALRSAQEIALTNSLVGVIPVCQIDDQECQTMGQAATLREHWLRHVR